MGAELSSSLPSNDQCLWPSSQGVGTRLLKLKSVWAGSVEVLSGSAGIGLQLWDWVPGQGGPSSAYSSDPICPCCMPALKQTARQPSPAVVGLAGGHPALMHAVCSHATSVKVQITAYTAVQMECSIKA